MTRSRDGVAFRFLIQYHLSSRRSTVKECDLETLNINSTKTSISRLILEKDVFRVVTSVGQRKNSESQFRAPMLYYWATETTVSKVYYKIYVTRVLRTAKIRNVDGVIF